MWEQKKYPLTHELGALAALCVRELGGNPDVVAALPMTGYAVAARYPGFEPSATEAERALRLARAAVLAVGRWLEENGCESGA